MTQLWKKTTVALPLKIRAVTADTKYRDEISPLIDYLESACSGWGVPLRTCFVHPAFALTGWA